LIKDDTDYKAKPPRNWVENQINTLKKGKKKQKKLK
jgi:hypothetical protein